MSERRAPYRALEGRTGLETPEAVSRAVRLVPAFSATLPYPPSVNSIWRRVGNKTLLSADGREYHARVENAVALLMTRYAVPPAPHAVRLSFVVPDRRKRDLDNLPKAVLDPLYRAFGMDDSVITRIEATKRYEGPGTSGSVTVLVWTDEEAA